MAEKRLGELLISKNIITDAQLEDALSEQDKSGIFLGEILVKKRYASEEEVTLALSEQLGFAYVDLERNKIEPGVAKLLPEAAARKFRAIPLFKSATALTVAMANPLDIKIAEEVERLVGMRVRPVFARPSQITRAIEEEYRQDSLRPPAKGIESVNLANMDSAQIASLAPVVSIVDNLIAEAVKSGASDIHLEPGASDFYCRFRIDGILHDMPRLPKQYEAAITSRLKIMASMDIAEKRLPQDGRIQAKVGSREIDLRVSTFPANYGENLVARILDKTRSLIRLEELGLAGAVLSGFKEMIQRPHGIILVTGPTGSGKTTTLYAVIKEINSLTKNIVTLEDPIEYEINRVCQSQVNVKAGLTFANGLRAIVRQDPNVIMIGEIRDHETAEIAIHAALTGHLVLSTLHTNDAASAATRLIDMETEPFLVSSALICVVAQRLLRLLCPKCKEPYAPDASLLARMKLPAADKPAAFYREKGCPECRQTGYAGRIGIFEMLIPDEDIRRLIEKKASAAEIRAVATQKGMFSLRQDGAQKVAKGLTSVSELLRVSQEP